MVAIFVALGAMLVAGLIAIPTIDVHMALAKNSKPKNPNYKRGHFIYSACE